MKKLFVVILFVFGVGYGQILNENVDGVSVHKIYQNYSKTSYTSSTANETTQYIPIKGVNKLAIFATCNDTIKAVLKYQFKSSFTGRYTGWAATTDSISLIGTSSSLAADRLHAFASSDTSTYGYDLIRYYIDYVTYLGVAYTGGTVKIYTDIYKP